MSYAKIRKEYNNKRSALEAEHKEALKASRHRKPLSKNGSYDTYGWRASSVITAGKDDRWASNTYKYKLHIKDDRTHRPTSLRIIRNGERIK